MISRQFIEYAETIYEKRLPFFGRRTENIEQAMNRCGPDEQILMKFLYGTMPLHDVGEYDFSLFHSFVSHALYLAETMDWCRGMPEDIFLHYVLYHRINSESIEDCRSFFCEQLLPRIQGLSAKEAVLEINYWCAENGSYESSDSRTISPMTMYRSGKGRCGEESVFAVTAFRSVGIPARQVYTPRWAHCDDNHAWVEVYVDGAWHFLGACEPEEVLDKGWFSHASSRALLVHTLTFSDYGANLPRPRPLFGCSDLTHPFSARTDNSDEYIGREGQIVYYNHTAFYAKSRKLEILVQDSAGHPVSHALVLVEILNMAEYSSAASLFTDEHGKTSITLGLGSIHLHAEKDGCWTEIMVSASHTGQVILCLPAACPDRARKAENTATEPQPESIWKNFTVEAPQDYPVHPVSLTAAQKKKNRARLSEAERLRENRIRGYYREDLARNYPCEAEILRSAAGNFDEIYQFLSKDESSDRRALLHHLSVKDYKDARAELLERHLEKASCFREQWENNDKLEVYVRYLLCPRIYLEELTDYRGYIQDYFSEKQKENFSKNPETIWQYIQNSIQNHAEQDYETLLSTPKGCLELSHGNVLSQKILFVAICRTLGIPSRMNPVTLEAEWYNHNGFISVSSVLSAADKNTDKNTMKFPALLTLSASENCPWQYYQHWTIGRLEGSRFVTLDYTGKTIASGKIELLLAAGTYRLITANRLPNGNQNAGEYVFTLESGEKKELFMQQTAVDFSDMLVSRQLDDFEVIPSHENAAPCRISSLLTKNATILAFLQEGQEPTEHVLNELLEQGNLLFEQNLQILFLLQGPNNTCKTLTAVLKRFPQIQTIYADFNELAEPIARRMYLEPEKYPLLLIVRQNMTAVYGNCGYHVGIIGLMEQIIRRSFP